MAGKAAPGRPEDRPLVRLHIVTVAEGVETLEQENYLRSHGVDVLQGFYYARPMPVEAFPAWLASREESESEGESETTE